MPPWRQGRRHHSSKHRLGPYIFHSDLGKEIPHYPDGRCFIDHGSFLEWRGQWFYAVSHGTESWSYRQSWLLYLHFCDDGTLMIDETIRRFNMGYAAGSMLFSPLPGILADLSKGSYVPAYLLFALFSLVQLLLIQGVYIRCSHRKAG